MTKTILFVEDDKAILKGLEDNFSREGYRVLTERDGKKGLATALKKQPDLVVLDVMLPTMDGFHICAVLKKRGFAHPIFVLTGMANEKSRVEGLQYGADDYIQKPFSIQELMLRVKNALSRTEQVLGKAKVMDEELRKAREIQLASTPKAPPAMKGIDLFGVMIPATHVGGDYFDYLPLDGGNLAIIVADVSGKGMPAALHVQKMQGIAQSSKSVIKSPADLLTQLEEHLGATMDPMSFVTAVAAVIDIRARTLTIANAGHLPVLCCRGPARQQSGGKKVEEIKSEGLWIGSLSVPQFRAKLEVLEVPIKKGDRFVFFTDGVIESMNERGEEFGMDRFKTLLLRSSGSSQQLSESIRKQLERFAGESDQHDDITIVALHITE